MHSPLEVSGSLWYRYFLYHRSQDILDCSVRRMHLAIREFMVISFSGNNSWLSPWSRTLADLNFLKISFLNIFSKSPVLRVCMVFFVGLAKCLHSLKVFQVKVIKINTTQFQKQKDFGVSTECRKEQTSLALRRAATRALPDLPSLSADIHPTLWFLLPVPPTVIRSSPEDLSAVDGDQEESQKTDMTSALSSQECGSSYRE